LKKIILGVAILGAGSLAAHHFYMTDKVQSVIEENVAQFNSNSNGQVELTHGDYGFGLDQNVFINNVKISNLHSKESIDLGNIILKDLDLEHEIPYYMEVQFDDIKLNINEMNLKGSNAAITNMLKEASINDVLSTSLSFSYKYSPEDNNSFKFDLGQNITNLANTELSLTIDQFDLAAINANQSKENKQGLVMMNLLSKIRLKNIELDFSDEKITEIVLSEAMKQDKKFKTKYEAETFLVNAIEKEKERNPKFNVKHYDEFIEIIRNKKGFTFSVTPTPLPVMELFQVVQKELQNTEDKSIKSLNVSFKAK
jgi:hypothetical protein